jgi:hypothetical protein
MEMAAILLVIVVALFRLSRRAQTCSDASRDRLDVSIRRTANDKALGRQCR